MAEANDLSRARPSEVKQMRAQLRTWINEMGAEVPDLNPDYDPADPLVEAKGRR
jgi:hypothetical protein